MRNESSAPLSLRHENVKSAAGVKLNTNDFATACSLPEQNGRRYRLDHMQRLRWYEFRERVAAFDVKGVRSGAR